VRAAPFWQLFRPYTAFCTRRDSTNVLVGLRGRFPLVPFVLLARPFSDGGAVRLANADSDQDLSQLTGHAVGKDGSNFAAKQSMHVHSLPRCSNCAVGKGMGEGIGT